MPNPMPNPSPNGNNQQPPNEEKQFLKSENELNINRIQDLLKGATINGS